MMVCFTIEIYRNLFVKKKKKNVEWSLKQSLLWAQRCVLDVIEVSLRCQTCVCCMLFTVFMYAAMYDV